MFWSRSNLYKAVYTDENLSEAWRNIKSNGKTAGIDGVNIDNYQAQQDIIHLTDFNKNHLMEARES